MFNILLLNCKYLRFTKDLKPQDINLSFLSGKGELNNLELDPTFLNEILQLPPWIEFRHAICDNIKAKVSYIIKVEYMWCTHDDNYIMYMHYDNGDDMGLFCFTIQVIEIPLIMKALPMYLPTNACINKARL